MRILLVTPFFYPHKGGSQQYAEELHATLMERNQNVEVDVLCYNTDGSKSVEKYRGFTIHRIPCRQLLKGQFAVPDYIALWKTLNKLFAKNRYDFINSHTRFFENSWWVPFIARYFKTKSVLTDHCASHPAHQKKLITYVSYVIDRLFVPLILPLYSEVIVTNKATQKFLKGFSKKKTRIIYGGVDTKFFKAKGANRKRKILGKRFSRNDIIVSFVGRMIYSKGPQLLLKAAEDILKRNRNVYFIFGGDGELYKYISKKQNDRILFTGALEKKDVAALLSTTDILVHPSLHHEGFPNVILEAGSAGCAVLATNQGGTYELINEDTGIIVKSTAHDIKNKLRYLFKNREKRLLYGRNLRNLIEKSYDWEKIADDYKKFIDRNITTLPVPSIRMASVPHN